MSQSMVEQLQQVRVGPPAEAGGLQVFGLFWQPALGPEYHTLDEAVAAGNLEVAEVHEGGSVPTLKVRNKGDQAVFLMAGEHLEGGKQNRVLNASIFVAGACELPIPVSCVERGRWAYRAAHFAGSGSSSHSLLRKMMHTQATFGYRSSGTPRSDQGAVWQEVDRKLSECGSLSETAYLHKAYEDTAAALAEVIGRLTPPEEACGTVFAYGGQIVGFDLFDRPATLVRLWPKLLRAYAIDARAAPEHTPVTTDAVQTWLGGVTAAREEVFKSPGLGEDVRLEAPALVAACLRVDDHPVHVEAFAQAG